MRRLLLTVTLLIVLGGTTGQTAAAHLVTKPKCKSLQCREKSQAKNQSHITYVAKRGGGQNRKWHRTWVPILKRELAETRAKIAWNTLDYWIRRQIAVATIIASAGGNHWPNCPDPFDYPRGRYSWQDTVNCENGGNWYDSPGFYRCGLQFHPNWELRYGRLCP
jgi:hypothetical protein